MQDIKTYVEQTLSLPCEEQKVLTVRNGKLGDDEPLISFADKDFLRLIITKDNAPPVRSISSPIKTAGACSPKGGRKLQFLKVRIIGASALHDPDWITKGNACDPYCVCEIAGKPDSKVQTEIIYEELSPVWNFEAGIVDYEPGDSLIFSLYDEPDGCMTIPLGRLTIASEQFYPDGFRGRLPLSEVGESVKAYLRLELLFSSVLGPVGRKDDADASVVEQLNARLQDALREKRSVEDERDLMSSQIHELEDQVSDLQKQLCKMGRLNSTERLDAKTDVLVK